MVGTVWQSRAAHNIAARKKRKRNIGRGKDKI
jgi:hypothetical protein